MVVVVLVVCVGYAFGTVFVMCELCQQVYDGFEKINKTMGQSHWLSYPTEVQRLLPIAIFFMQQPIEFNVFGSITCCRESFKNVSSID